MDYITQDTLIDLITTFDNFTLVGTEVRVEKTLKRWDSLFKVDDTYYVVEYDGDQHYHNSLVMYSDSFKDNIAQQKGYITIRWPYWVQPTPETIKHYFNVDSTYCQNFKHGFRATKVFPASFSRLGFDRYQRELQSLPKSVKDEVEESLIEKALIYGDEFVR